MSEIHVRIEGDREVERRIRSLLEEEGIRTTNVSTADRVLVERVEELERTVVELRNIDAAKSRFLANVSHELRTPLTAIITYGEVLRDGLLGSVNEKQRDAAGSLVGSGRQLLSMIEEILTYAKANAQAMDVTLGEVDLKELVKEAYDTNASLIEQKELRFECDIPGDLPPATADRDKLTHVVRNLIGNAIEFTAPGGMIRITARPDDEAKGWLEVCVEDDGIGIDPEHHEMIFQEFAQVDTSRARQHHGTGLGLAIARNFIELHEGSIWVESAPSEGSRFFFRIPAAEGCEERAGG